MENISNFIQTKLPRSCYTSLKVVALGDSNGFTAMIFNNDDGSIQAAGMNLEEYNWKQFVLNTLHWLSNKIE